MKTTLSADKEQIREVYVPMMANLLTAPLQSQGKVKGCLFFFFTTDLFIKCILFNFKDGIDEVIKLMDSYYLNREDYDSILELGIGNMDKDKLMKEIPTAVKSAFTST